MTFDLKDYRKALGSFATGVTIVTCLDGAGQAHGLTVNSFTSVSLDPPLVLWCLGNKSDSYDLFSNSTHFAINVLNGDQRDLAMRFAGQGDQRLGAGEYARLNTGAPCLKDAIATFDCLVTERIEAGDHLILIGHTQAYQTAPASGLTYYRGQFGEIGGASAS